ncbi:MAG: hypothetical protein JWN32_4378 [Solirubrobacterales bacterium]|jgi:hypothetical protein|nr:hypothetical protein [Solirubrobacterales bacterium]
MVAITVVPPHDVLRREGIQARRIYWVDGSRVGYVDRDGHAHTAVIETQRGRATVVRVLPGWPA